ncbi:Alpha-(1,3)-fucosyltransferase 7 [Dermatophagoides pteronyssinus]|uniref:Fucosyltransferase n=1 Tax=Dermatophagoides pteronyssinus TaxID=6956 RepID=A0ABQ8JR46_DERPT|nr:Alpha-(1,3)-fucosyltransferase 7 [Dermatophagoides pteronyssinus]
MSRYRCLFFLCIILSIIFIVTINTSFRWYQIPLTTSTTTTTNKMKMNEYNQKLVIKNDPDYDRFLINQMTEQTTTTTTTTMINITNQSSGKKKRKNQLLRHYSLILNENFNQLPWFMPNGTLRPSNNNNNDLILWPEEMTVNDDKSMNDRIINQLMYIPNNYDEQQFYPKGHRSLKKILLAFGKQSWPGLPMGRQIFIEDKCPVNACFIMSNKALIDKADAVIFKDRFIWPSKGRPSIKQIWILFLLESPLHTQVFSSLPSNVINWTATYRHDSDIVAPYAKFFTFNNSKHQTTKNYAKGKTKKVAWFVSNCGAKNKRLEYARELSRHIDVDIYGSCGEHKCPRSKANECLDMLNNDYKFYLAFENSNCRDYITEKFYLNGLGENRPDLNIIPIVMGAHPDDYRRSSPPNSYIHVDDFESPKQLAKYLNQLDQNDDEYNHYFEWKQQGLFINTYFWCRLCALLHANDNDNGKPTNSYENIHHWWTSISTFNIHDNDYNNNNTAYLYEKYNSTLANP